MKNKWLVILLILTFIKGIIWLILTPIFQIPDEASHFARIQAISESGREFNPRRIRPTSQEIFKVSKIVNFSWEINHPMWRGYENNWQSQLNQISLADKKILVHNDLQTASKRPALYYWLSRPFYLLFSRQPFIFSFFSVRFFSVLINLATVYLTFLLAKLFFKHSLLPLASASLVAFQPMLSFIDIGVHYDPLTILVATFFLYLALTRRLLPSLFLALLGIFVNPNLIFLILAFLLLLSGKAKKFIPFFGLVILLILILIFSLFPLAINKYPFLDNLIYLANFNEYGQQIQAFFSALISGNLFSQFQQYLVATGKINLAQVFPWYWGVFGWLEKTLPLIVYRIIKLIIIASLIGWAKYFLSRPKMKSLFFLIYASILNLVIVILNDFLVFAGSGSNFGIQGRYLLPMISAHMILLIFGLSRLIPVKYHRPLAISLILSGFFLNLIGLAGLYQFFGWVWS